MVLALNGMQPKMATMAPAPDMAFQRLFNNEAKARNARNPIH